MDSAIITSDCSFILAHSPCGFGKLKNKRILIAGGTGYYGKWFLQSFAYINEKLNLNSEMYIVSRSPESFLREYPAFAKYGGIYFIKGDVRDFKFPSGNFSYLIHAATEVVSGQERSNPDEMMRVAEHGTENLLRFARYASVERLLLTSSGAIYGPQPCDVANMPETHLASPTTIYGKAKKLSEDICLSSGGLHCSIARCYASVGPWLRLDVQYAVGNFIQNVLRGEPIFIKGDGRPYRSYLYIADLISWLWTILLEGKSGEAYNVGSNIPVSIAELAQAVIDAASVNTIIEYGMKPDFSVPAPRYVPDVSKIKNSLGVAQYFSLREGIKNTIAWHLSGTMK